MAGRVMKRRDFMGFIGGALVYPATTRAQQSDRIRRIGVLANAEAQDPEWQRQIAAFDEAKSCKFRQHYLAGIGFEVR